MKNYVQRGDVLTVPAPAGGVPSGGGVLVGALFGVAATAQPEGADVEIATVGVYRLPKAAVAITLGAKVYWTGSAISTTASGNTPVGIATAAAATGAADVPVRLNGSF